MNNYKKPFSPVILAASLSMLLMGCQSAPKSDAGIDMIDGQHVADISADLKKVMAKQQQHDELLKEWQQLKPAISRMLVIEEELNLMINQLDQLSHANTTETAAQPVKAEAMPASVAAPVIAKEAVVTGKNAKFALQITSLSEPLRLPVVWQQMQKKYAQPLAGMEANYQKISVNNSDYYRLKIGAFSAKQAAVDKCNQLKSLGINCLVTNYNQSDFSELNQM